MSIKNTLKTGVVIALLTINFTGCESATIEEKYNALELEAKKAQVVSTNFKEFSANYKSMTELQQQKYWEEVEDKYVQWTGEVFQVNKDFILVRILDHTITGNVAVYLTHNQRDEMLTINKGDTITFKGYLADNPGIVGWWEVGNAVIVDKK